jgi:glycerate-2-kinase
MNIPDPGEGGPSQQFAISAATYLEGTNGNIVITGIDTDGTDGPTEYAGGIVDSSSFDKAKELGLDLFAYMDAFNDTVALKELGDLIFTGGTGTNVNDLRVMLIV